MAVLRHGVPAAEPPRRLLRCSRRPCRHHARHGLRQCRWCHGHGPGRHNLRVVRTLPADTYPGHSCAAAAQCSACCVSLHDPPAPESAQVRTGVWIEQCDGKPVPCTPGILATSACMHPSVSRQALLDFKAATCHVQVDCNLTVHACQNSTKPLESSSQ